MSQSFQIQAQEPFNGAGMSGPATVLIRDGGIAEARLSTEVAPGEAGPRVAERFMTPGMVDIQVNGAMGMSFLDCGEAGVRRIGAELARRGTTSFLATLVTAPRETMLTAVENLAPLVGVVPGLEGLHIEGPFLNPERRGAHPPDQIRLPDWEEAEAWLKAGGGTVRVVTLAPELEGGLELVDRLAGAGVTVAAGHTDATYETMAAAVTRGLRLVTHAGKVADWPKRVPQETIPRLRSEPSVVGSVLALEELACSVIGDGYHLHPALLRALIWAKPGRVAIISDLTALAGLGPGRYETSGLRAQITQEGIAVVPEGDFLAGSVRFQKDALALCVGRAEIAPAAVLAALTSTPARLAGLYPRKGALAPGADADVLVWNQALELTEVYQRGERIG